MSNTILLKRSSVANAIPSTANVSIGELAINTRDGKLYTKIRPDGITDEIFELTQNQLITLGGDVTGSGISNISVSLNAAQPNITSVGNLTSLSVTGAISGSNVSLTGNLVATGNITGEYLIANNAVIGNVSFSDINTGNITATGFANITGNVLGGNLITVGNVDATGNVAGNYFIGNGRFLSGIDTTLISNGATEVRTYLNGNVAFTINGVANVVLVTPNGITVVGNANSGNVNTTAVFATTANITGNVNSGNVNSGFVSVTGDATIGGNITTGGGSGGNITGANVVSANTFTAAANVNSAGATVTGNVTAGNIATAGALNAGSIESATTITATGNITGGNLTTAGLTNSGTLSVTANANVGNLGTAGLVVATGNITGGNLVTGGVVQATGNVNGSNLNAAANITGGNIIATANVNGGNINTNKLSTLSGDVEITTGATNGNVLLLPTGSGNVVINDSFVNGVRNPIQAQDAATKQYVDDAVSTGITIHTPVRLEANSAVNGTYAQGGTTATVTDTVAGNTVVFSSAIDPQVNDQLWFANSFNGVVANTAYFVVSAPNTSAAVLSRAYNGAPVSDITSGSSLTQSVRINSGQGATLTNAGANATLVIDGVTVNNGDRILIYAQANAAHNGVYDVTEAGNATTAWQLTRSSDMDTYIPDNILGLDVGDYFYVQEGDSGAGESYVMTAPVGPTIIGLDNLVFTQFSSSQVYTANTSAGLVLVGTQFNAKVDNDTTAFDGLGNIIVKASANLVTPNIGAATGTSLAVTANVSGGNLTTTGQVTATGNITGGNVTTAGLTNSATLSVTGNANVGNLGTAGLVVATGNITGGNLVTIGLTNTGTLSVTNNANVGNLGTTGFVIATGNIDGGNVNSANAVTAGTTVDAVGNITGGNLTTAGLISGGTLSVTANANVGNLGTAGLIVATGNITGGNITTAGLTSTGTLSASGNANVGNLGTAGSIAATGNVSGGNLITVGNATVTGNAAVGGILTDNYYYANGAPVDFQQPAGANTEVQFNANGDFGASNKFTFNSATDVLTVVGNIDAANMNATTVTATGNVSGGNLTTAGRVVATGNIVGGNISTTGIGAVATLTVSTFANITATTESTSTTTGSLITAGGIGVAGNVHANQIYGGTIYENGSEVLNVNDTIDGGSY